MFINFEERPSDSPLVERVWRSHSERSDEFSSIAACTWDMVLSRGRGGTSMIVRGPETRATNAYCPTDGEWFAIRFKCGTYMPHFPPSILRDRNDVVLPNAASRSFWLNGSAWDFPDFDNAETFVNRLVRRALLVTDPLLSDVLQGYIPPSTSDRTVQRRFLSIAGLTRSAVEQIERARSATLMLREGRSILDTVFEAGYYDQAHLTRSLKHFVGQTPAQIIRGERQLSFLYNTDAA